MQFISQKSDLLKGLTIASRAAASKSTQAILTCVLFEVGENIRITGNDTEIAIQTAVEGDIKTPGVAAVDAKFMLDMVKKLPNGDVEVETKNDTMTIKSGKTKFSVPFRDGEDFPKIPETDGGIHFTMAGYEFKDLVRQVAFAAAPSSANRVMEGINLGIKDDVLTATALDGRRIAMRSIVIGDSPDTTAIIPAKTMREIAGIVDDSDTHFYITEKFITADFENTTVVSRLVEGTYFDIEKILNVESGTIAKIKREALYSCVDRASILTRDSKKPIIASITDKINIQIKSPQGSMNEDISADVTGEEIKIGFDPAFMLDALGAIEDSDIYIHFSNPKAPIIIKDEEKTYKYVVLPVNFAED